MKKLAIITGFLGSGKTTLLNRLLKEPAMASTAVLVNELGEVGVDHLIIDQFDDDIVLLESGCVCCSIRDDLTSSLLTLNSRSECGDIPRFSQAVLETTGIADPTAILQLLMADKSVCERYQLGPVTTVVDACYGADNLRVVPEALRQVLLAERLAVSKTDLAGDAETGATMNLLRDLNPTALILDCRDFGPEHLLADSFMQGIVAVAPETGHGSRFSTYQVAWQKAVDWAAVEVWIEGLLSARGDDIWRIKGIMNVENNPLPVVFQSVQHSVYSPAQLTKWPHNEKRTELTFIVRSFPRDAALASLRPFVELNESDR